MLTFFFYNVNLDLDLNLDQNTRAEYANNEADCLMAVISVNIITLYVNFTKLAVNQTHDDSFMAF